ncbi:hypothetical protein I4U23_017785 [Adineta vaga]|nr:hypothetical protein I4U23_017785 [Adineta vaga]
MAAAQPAYDYSSYDYAYDGSASSAYPAYAGYETSASYAPPGTYDAYAASAAYPPNPYSGYPTTAYAYPTSAPGAPAAAAASQASYSATYGSSPTTAGYTYDSRRSTPPPPASAAAHYASYDYASSAAGAYASAPPPPPPPGTTYSPYKTGHTANGASSASAYSTYPAAAPPPHGAYGLPPGSHLSGTMGPPPPPPHVYGPPPSAAGMIPRRPEYYSPAPMHHSMHYVPQQPQSLHYRLPPRGGYQRELDEPGDENALLRHVIYVTGLPKEIQNETLADVFSGVCGTIAPVDVRSPKPKIWVYKDRQTREGKGEATITFINPESCQTAISYFDGKELFGREIRVTLCPRRMYNMQKQNTPFNPAAPSNNSNSMIKQINTNNIINTTTADSSTSSSLATAVTTTTTPASPTAVSTSTNTSVSTTTTTTATSKPTTPTVTAANPIATISSSTLGLPRQLNHSLFKLRQTPEQQRGLLPTPPIPYGTPMIGNVAGQRDGVRKELPRIALNRGNYNNPTGVRPKPY